MEYLAYQAFTRQLVNNLSNKQDVIGLVAVGSMAEQVTFPDQWSDHDFYLIVGKGSQEYYRTNQDWLPDSEHIVLVLRETEHGVKVLYDIGHLLEFAVFDLNELDLARTNRYQVLIDKSMIEERMIVNAQKSLEGIDRRSDAYHAGQFLTNLLVGIGRYRRGELINANRFIKMSAMGHLIELLIRHKSSDNTQLIDTLDPTRRFELIYPELGTRLDDLLLLELPEAVLGLLDVFTEEMKDVAESKQAVETIRVFLNNSEGGHSQG